MDGPDADPYPLLPALRAMRRYALVAGSLAGLFLALFLAAESLALPGLHDPSAWLGRGGAGAAAAGVGLLVADVVLPVPSSLVMVLHGTLFGVAAGTLLSLAGGVGAMLLAFGIGRRGGPLLERVVGPEERARADALLRRWGALAIVATRPVPILAETVAILAGASSLGWGTATLAAAAGLLPLAGVYAVAGATAARAADGMLASALVFLVTAAGWALGRWAGPRLGAREDAAAPDRTAP